MPPVRTLLIDDSATFLASVQGFLADHPRVHVVGTAPSGHEGVAEAIRLRPDLVLLDLVMPGMSGLEALRRIKAMPAPPRVVVLTFQEEPEFRTEALARGADGYVTKLGMAAGLLPVLLALFPDPETRTVSEFHTPVYAESIFATAREAFLLLDDGPRVRAANRAFYETFRATPDETQGRLLYDLGAGQWDIPRLRLLLDEIIPRDGHLQDFQVELDFPDLGRRVMVLNARRVSETGGPGRRIFLAIDDVTEMHRAREEARRLREELEERVRERTADLESFSYSVSHDLRSPLRALDGFARILLDDYAPVLPPEAREYVHDICRNAKKMGQLVDDLLTFSRLGRQSVLRLPVAPAALVREVLDDLRAEREARQVEVVVGDLPACHADPALLKQVWANLIGNAFKYTRKHDPARIEIGSVERDGERVYFVRDTGVGFDMRYAGKLFGVFQRLHKAADYDGTGVGLAIVRRVITRHGGGVWAEAAVNRGATFYFTVPAEGEPSHPAVPQVSTPPGLVPAAPDRPAGAQTTGGGPTRPGQETGQ